MPEYEKLSSGELFLATKGARDFSPCLSISPCNRLALESPLSFKE
jgi:hypothetical protein